MNMSRELCNQCMRLLGRRQTYSELMKLLRWETTSITEEMNVLIAHSTEKDLQEALLVKDSRGWLPIHWACMFDAPLEVIQMLLDNDSGKKTILAKDNEGWLPIHVACFYGTPLEVIQLLLDCDNNKKTIFEKDNPGRLPIHRACRGGATVEVIRLLLDSDADKKMIFEKDKYGWLPINYAFGGPVAVVQLLLQASICDRIEQLGLAQWRISMQEIINAITEEDSKTRKIQEIYARLSNYEEMERTISLLALAVWRTSCLKWGDIQFKSMQEMEDYWPTDEIFEPSENKRERRIKSGADVIIRGVLQFLLIHDDSE
jgi:hypothetical protein